MTIIRRLAAAALLVALAPVPVFATELESSEVVAAPAGSGRTIQRALSPRNSCAYRKLQSSPY